jgi:dTMP kinase
MTSRAIPHLNDASSTHPDSGSAAGSVAGKFIVVEGGEGSGKTTQLHRIYTWLHQAPKLQSLRNQKLITDIVLTREPGGTSLGQSIRHLLLTPNGEEEMQETTELLLYAADRAQHVQAFLKPTLAQGAIILCDRYTDSTVAYQGYGRGLDLGLIDRLNAIATGGLQSDLTLWLDVPVEMGAARTRQRGTLDRLEQASLDFHERVRLGFQALAAAHPQRIVRIDASLSEEAVAVQIQTVIERQLQQWYASHLPR